MPRWLYTFVLCCFSFVAIGVAPQSAHAEDKAKAIRLMGKGEKALARGDRFIEQEKPEKAMAAYSEALDLFNEAYGEFSSSQLYYPIAKAEQGLGRNLDAMRHYQAVLQGSQNAKPELVEKIDAAIQEIRERLVAIDLKVEQDGAVVSVDGVDIGLTPLDGLQYMEAGEHTYSISLEGHAPLEEKFDLDPGEVLTREVTLKAEAHSVTSTDDGEEDIDGWASKKLPTVRTKSLTISFGLAGVMFAGAGFTALAAKSRYDRYQDFSLSVDERTKAQASGKTYRLAADILLGTGILAAAYGTYYYYGTYKKESRRRSRVESRRLSVIPYATGSEAGVALGGRF